MATCSVCGEEIVEDRVYQCYDCGRVYCKECVKKYPTIKTLGLCPDCEEALTGEEEYWE